MLVPPEQLVPVVHGQLLGRVVQQVVHRLAELVHQAPAHENLLLLLLLLARRLVARREPVPAKILI